MISSDPLFTILLPRAILPGKGNNGSDDSLAEQFATSVTRLLESHLGLTTFVPMARGEANLDTGFEDFEANYLASSTSTLICMSADNIACMDYIYPRLLVFITRRPVWREKIMVVFLGQTVEHRCSMLLNEWDILTQCPIFFQGKTEDEWLVDRHAWNVLLGRKRVGEIFPAPDCDQMVYDQESHQCEQEIATNEGAPVRDSNSVIVFAVASTACTLNWNQSQPTNHNSRSDRPNQLYNGEIDPAKSSALSVRGLATANDAIDGQLRQLGEEPGCNHDHMHLNCFCGKKARPNGHANREDTAYGPNGKTEQKLDQSIKSLMLTQKSEEPVQASQLPPQEAVVAFNEARQIENVIDLIQESRYVSLELGPPPNVTIKQSFDMEMIPDRNDSIDSGALTCSNEDEEEEMVVSDTIPKLFSSLMDYNVILPASLSPPSQSRNFPRSATDDHIMHASFPSGDLETIMEKTESLYDMSAATNRTQLARSSGGKSNGSGSSDLTFSACGAHPWGTEAYGSPSNKTNSDASSYDEVAGQHESNIVGASSLRTTNDDSGMCESFSPDSVQLEVPPAQAPNSASFWNSFQQPGKVYLARPESIAGSHTRESSQSPIYREEVRKPPIFGEHTSRYDKHLYSNGSRQRTFSSRFDNELPQQDVHANRQIMTRSVDRTLFVDCGVQTCCELLDVENLPQASCCSNDSLFQHQNNEIYSKQLPDGGWLTGVFSWFVGGRRAITPRISRRASRTGAAGLARAPSLNLPPPNHDNANCNTGLNDLSMVSPVSREASLMATPSLSTVLYGGEARSPSLSRRNNRLQRYWATDFAISLINTSMHYMPRHMYWFYTSACLTQQRLSELIHEYDRKAPEIIARAKRSIQAQAKEGASCVFVGTALANTSASRLLPLAVNGAMKEMNLSDRLLSYRFGTMTSLLKPSLVWTGNTVLTRLTPRVYSAAPSPR